MSNYSCACGYETTHISHLRRHLANKTPCNPIPGKTTSYVEPDITLPVYECECGYETNNKSHLRRHLQKKISCMPGKNMSKVEPGTLLKSILLREAPPTPIEIKQHNFEDRRRYLGGHTVKEYSSRILSSMKQNTEHRNQKDRIKLAMPTWKVEDIIKILENNDVYIVDTDIGILEFPLMLTNGYYNSASFDRINDDLGYTDENYEIRPRFLNSFCKLNTFHISELVVMREQYRTLVELLDICKLVNVQENKNNFFYGLASHAKGLSENRIKRNITFDFGTQTDCAIFLKELYIKQGGRCAYSKIPIYPITNHIYKASIERKDPMKSYNRDNIALIVIGLNGCPNGQFINPDLTDDQRKKALEAGIFNQEYWDTCTKLTSERRYKCDTIINIESRILRKYILV